MIFVENLFILSRIKNYIIQCWGQHPPSGVVLVIV